MQVSLTEGSEELVYDGRKLVSCRTYLQCILGRAELFRKGVTNIPSGLPYAFYQLMLRSPSDVDHTMNSNQCKRKLKELAGVSLELEDLIKQPKRLERSVPPPSLAIEEDPDIHGDVGFDSDTGGRDVAKSHPSSSSKTPAAPPPLPPPPDTTARSGSPSSSSSSSESSSSSSSSSPRHSERDDHLNIQGGMPHSVLQGIPIDLQSSPPPSEI